MLSKTLAKSNGHNLTDKEIITRLYFDNYDLNPAYYDKENYIPAKSFYENYFRQNQKQVPMKFITISLMSYVVGVGFGIFMLAFQSMGTGMGMPGPLDDKKYKYENLSEVTQAIKSV